MASVRPPSSTATVAPTINGSVSAAPSPSDASGDQRSGRSHQEPVVATVSGDPLIAKLRELYLALASEAVPDGILALLKQIE